MMSDRMSPHPIPEALELDTLEQFNALLSPRRLELVEALDTPRSAKELAGELGVPVTRLYYHLNTLTSHGIIRVVEERPRGALVERVYQVAGSSIRPSAAFLERYGGAGLAEVATLAFRHAESRFATAAREGRLSLEKDHPRRSAAIGLATMRLSRERLDALVRAVEALQEEFGKEEGDIEVSFFQAVHVRGDRP